MINSFEELVIWQRSRELTKSIYLLLQNNLDYGLRNQIQRASVSIMSNIAEGFGRSKHSQTNAMFIHFLGISLGSCNETKSLLYLAEDLGYLSQIECRNLRELCTDIDFKINALVNVLQSNAKPTGTDKHNMTNRN